MIRGITKNIAVSPVSYKELDEAEVFVPARSDLRNGYLSDAGNWLRRPGYQDWRDTGSDTPVSLLIPHDSGYAVTEDGKVFSLLDTPLELSASVLGEYRPTFSKHNDIVTICRGGIPMKIDQGVVSVLGGSPPNGRFVSRIGPYSMMSGYRDAEGEYTEFKWSASGNPENWTTGDSGFASVKKIGGRIRNTIVLREKVYHFQDNAVETWVNVGGDAVFARQSGSWIGEGIGADYSAVEANDSLYWFNDSGDFVALDGISPKVVSKAYRSELDKLVSPSSIVGFNFKKEHVIRWFAPVDGRCFTLDYASQTFSEDNLWKYGQWERLPINSYMEMNNRQYFGDYDHTGKVYEWTKDKKSDNLRPIRHYQKMAIQPSADGRNVRFNQLGFRVGR